MEREEIKKRIVADVKAKARNNQLFAFIILHDQEHEAVIEPIKYKLDISEDFADWLLCTYNPDTYEDFIEEFGIEDLRVCHQCGSFVCVDDGVCVNGEWFCDIDCAREVYGCDVN